MKTIRLLLLAIMIIAFSTVNGQFLHLGLKAYVIPMQKMTFFQYDIDDYVYYFANEYNETIRFNGFEASETSSYVPFPSIYVRYDQGNNLFFQFEGFGSWTSSEAKYFNSVDFPDYAEVFNPNSQRENLGYNNIKLKWAFLGNTLSAGYTFMKTKAIRPYVFGGLTTLFLVGFKPGDYYEDSRAVRNAIIFNNLDTFKKTTFHYRFGAGVKYHGLSLDVYLENNLGDVDRHAGGSESENYHERPNYKTLSSINVSLSLNLMSFNLSKNQNLN